MRSTAVSISNMMAPVFAVDALAHRSVCFHEKHGPIRRTDPSCAQGVARQRDRTCDGQAMVRSRAGRSRRQFQPKVAGRRIPRGEAAVSHAPLRENTVKSERATIRPRCYTVAAGSVRDRLKTPNGSFPPLLAKVIPGKTVDSTLLPYTSQP